ncbi:MAG: crosslink repair DNA glycosylase YcaQ family protein, partial [Leifsonia flava]
DREDALDEVALRYYLGHGPATVADLAWWAHLTVNDVRRATARVADRLATVTVGATTYYGSADVLERATEAPGARSVHALPGFDENLLGYTDRTPALAAEHAQLIVPGNNGMFKASIVAGGRVVGTWSRTERPSSIRVTGHPFSELSSGTRSALLRALERYGQFKGKPVELTVAPAGEPAEGL